MAFDLEEFKQWLGEAPFDTRVGNVLEKIAEMERPAFGDLHVGCFFLRLDEDNAAVWLAVGNGQALLLGGNLFNELPADTPVTRLYASFTPEG